MTKGFKMMEAKVPELDAKINPSCEVAPCTPSPTSSGKKRKIARHPDLSVSQAYSNQSKHCSMFFITFDHFDILKRKEDFWRPFSFQKFKFRVSSSNFSHYGVGFTVGKLCVHNFKHNAIIVGVMLK